METALAAYAARMPKDEEDEMEFGWLSGGSNFLVVSTCFNRCCIQQLNAWSPHPSTHPTFGQNLYTNWSFSSNDARSWSNEQIRRPNRTESEKQGRRLIRRPVKGCRFFNSSFNFRKTKRGICGTFDGSPSKREFIFDGRHEGQE